MTLPPMTAAREPRLASASSQALRRTLAALAVSLGPGLALTTACPARDGQTSSETTPRRAPPQPAFEPAPTHLSAGGLLIPTPAPITAR